MVQLPLVQSEAIEQFFPAAHGAHVLLLLRPPQSTSVSAPFLMPLAQLVHLKLRQPLLWQSVGDLHSRPSAHVGQTPPPQSTAVSLPSGASLAQVAA